MTVNELITVLDHLTPEERNLPMRIDSDLAEYSTEDIRSVVIEKASDGDQLILVSAYSAGLGYTYGDILRVVWEHPQFRAH